MPRLLPIENSHPALLALRRTLWQLAILGVISAVAAGALANAPGVLPAWLLLTPAAALVTHHRQTFLALLRTAANGERDAGARRRPLRRQANQRCDAMSRRRLSRQPLPSKQVR